MAATPRCLLLLCLAAVFAGAVDGLCGDWKNCFDCLDAMSWKGAKCEWCALTQTCLPVGKTSNCTTSQTIKTRIGCAPYKSKFNPVIAHKLLMHSAVAHSPNASLYLKKALPCSTFTDVKQNIMPCNLGNCTGTYAIDHSAKEIVIAFAVARNTTRNVKEELLQSPKVNASFVGGSKVLGDFKKAYNSVWPAMKTDLGKFIQKHPSYKVRVTGHSDGGALASMASTSLSMDGNTTLSKVSLYTFGQPRVGTVGYAIMHDSIVLESWRVVHAKDPIAHTPSCLSVPWMGCVQRAHSPYHHGTEIFYKEPKMTVSSAFKTCTGFPKDEDKSCSNSPAIMTEIMKDTQKAMEDHNKYYGVQVATWWKTQNPNEVLQGEVCMTKLAGAATNVAANPVFAVVVLVVSYLMRIF